MGGGLPRVQIEVSSQGHQDAQAGLEFQGMVAIVRRRDGSFFDVTLPGSTLIYGLQDLTAKTVCLVWGIWLLCGPGVVEVLYFITKTGCITTDGGTEIGTVEMWNMLYCFMRWVAGVPFSELSAFARPNERLFSKSIRISGWSHGFGNLAKGAAWTWNRFSEMLDDVKVLCRFWRNKTWKLHVKKALRHRDDLDLTILDKRVPDLAKWRYQTLMVVFGSLLQFRTICENDFRPEWFADAQEKETLAGVWKACKTPILWRYMAASHREVYKPIERQRRWGMICTCPEHIRMRQEGKRNINCYWNGRRLPEAWDYIQDQSAQMRARTRTLTLHDVEGDRELYPVIKKMLDFAASQGKGRTKFYGVAPWSFARAGTRQGAKEFLDMVAKYPIEQHDDITIGLMRDFGYMLQQFVAGEDADPALIEGIRVFNTVANLDEARGEGYHKEPTLEKKRAPASTSKRLKQSTRYRKTFRHMNAFKKRYGARGREVIRYEWTNYKRLLRPAGPRQWRPVKMPVEAFYRRVYREDDAAELNWSSLASKPPPKRPVQHDQPSNVERLNNEYIMALVEAGNHYSVSAPPPAPPAADEEVVPAGQAVHFKLVNTVTSQARPHTMPTVCSADEVENCAAVAFEIVKEEPETVDGEDAPGIRNVRFESEAQWIRPCDITNFESFNKTLMVWKHAEPSALVPGCTELSCVERAKVRFGVLDDRCPVLAIIQHLKNRGWNPVHGVVEHTTAAIGDFDCVEAPRQKRYLQVICTIDACLPYTSSIPSRQVIHFYDCLLRRIAVEPNCGNAVYALALNAKRQKDGRKPNVLPLADEVLNVLPDDDDDGIIGGPIVQRPEPRSRPKPVVVASRTGARSSRDPAPICPTPAIDPVPPSVGLGGGGGEPGPPPVPAPVVGGDGDSDDGLIGAGPLALARPRGSTAGQHEKTCDGLTPGTEITYKDYQTPGGKSYPNYSITCTRCPPGECPGRTRGDLPQFKAMSGDIEPLAYLHMWEAMVVPSGKRHNKQNPKSAAVASFAEENRDALTALRRELHDRG